MTGFVSLVTHYGYLGVAAIVTVEGLGVPLPGETALLAAAALAGAGQLSIVGVILAAWAGTIAGGSGGYWIGRLGGIALVKRHGRWIRLDQQRLDRAHEWFDRRGALTVFIARFVALLRLVVGLVAGSACMSFLRFSIANALGGLAWAIAFGLLGYVFGQNLPALHGYVGRAGLALALLVALVVVVALAVRWFRDHRAAIARSVAARWQRLVTSPPMLALRERYPRAWSFVAARFMRGEYLGLHLTIGLLVSLLALVGFAAITEDVVTNDPLTVFDLRVAAWFHAHSTPTGIRLAVFASTVGSPVGMAILALGVSAYLAARRWWIILAGWVAAFLGGVLLNLALKTAIHRARPEGAMAFLTRFSYSFPSGHAMGALIGFGMLGYVITAHHLDDRRREKTVIILACALAALAIAFSRIYLGVHYFSDVVGGLAAGTVWLASCISGVEVALRQRAFVVRRTR